MKLSILLCLAALLAAFCPRMASAQTNGSGRAVAVATPTPGPSGTASTALNSSLNGGIENGQGSMGTGVNVPAAVPQAPQAGSVSPIVPGSITINSNASSAGTGNVAGSVQINNGGAGSVSAAPVPISPIPTYVTPGTGLGTNPSGGIVPNPNPGSVQ